MNIVKIWVLLISIVNAVIPPGWETMTEGCQEKMFPITVGGMYDEVVNCTLHDEKNQQIIVAGSTESPDFGPAENPHGFIYAVDYEGNWAWGQFFYNKSSAMGPISGCMLDSNNHLIIYGNADGRPYLMRGDPATKLKAIEYLTLEPVVEDEDEDETPKTFRLFQAVHHDPQDQMYYVSFLLGADLFVLKVDAGPEMSIAQSVTIKAKNDEFAPWKDAMLPKFLIQDPSDKDSLLLIGQLENRGSFIKLSKSNLRSSWKLLFKKDYSYPIEALADDSDPSLFSTGTGEDQKFFKLKPTEYGTTITDIMSIVIPERSEDIFGCGYAHLRPGQFEPDYAEDFKVPHPVDPAGIMGSQAGFFGVSSDGDVKFVFQLGVEEDPDNPQGYYFETMYQHGVCRSIAYDSERKNLVAMMETNTRSLRPDMEDRYPDSGAFDIVILSITTGGTVKGAWNINQDKSGSTIDLGYHSATSIGKNYFFGGFSLGYQTRYQTLIEDWDLDMYMDVHLFKFNPYSSNQCLYHSEVRSRDLKNAVIKYDSRDSQDFKGFKYIFTAANGRFTVWTQEKMTLVKGFDLLSKWKIPRLCSKSGGILERTEYYIGTSAEAYSVSQQSSYGPFVSQMNNGQYWMFTNGTNAEGLIGKWDRYGNGGSFLISTHDASLAGQYSTILRGCSRQDMLIELGLDIEIKANQGPKFVSKLQTYFEVQVGEEYTYYLPKLRDNEQNAPPEVYIDYTEDSNIDYPPYMFFNNITKSLTFRPHTIWYQGFSYGFDVVTKESGSDTLYERTQVTVRVPGNVIDPQEYLNFTDITFELKRFDKAGYGTLVFSHPLNLSFVEENWDSLFHVYYQNSTYMQHQFNSSDYKFTFVGSEGDRVVNFKVNFDEPYYIAVMETRPSVVFVQMKHHILDVYGRIKDPQFQPMVYGNSSLTRFFYETVKVDSMFESDDHYEGRMLVLSSAECPKMFDFDNDVMYFFRQFAEKVYWILGGFFFCNTIIVFRSRITTLPLWTFLEFMQLYSYLPLLHFNLLPYIYDIFKPFLVSHLILTDDALMMEEYKMRYFGDKYQEYTLTIADMGQSLALYFVLFVLLLVSNLLVWIAHRFTPNGSETKPKIAWVLSQFKFNAYIKYYQLSYLDLTYDAILKLQQVDRTPLDKKFTLFSQCLLVLNVALPMFFMTVVLWRFKVLSLKEYRQKFSILITGIDKGQKKRLFQVIYFFIRRLVFCYCMATESLKMRYTIIVFFTIFGVVWTNGLEPYKHKYINLYMGMMEFLYLACLIFFIVFTDILPDIPTKVICSAIFFGIVCMVMLINLIFSIYLLVKDRQNFKLEIEEFKQKRMIIDFERLEAQEQAYQDDIDDVNARRREKGLINDKDQSKFMMDFFQKTGIVNVLRNELSNNIRSQMKSKIKKNKKAKKALRKQQDGDDEEGDHLSDGNSGSDESNKPGVEDKADKFSQKRDEDYDNQIFEGDFRMPLGKAALFGRLQELMDIYKQKRKQTMGELLPQQDIEQGPEEGEFDPFKKPAKGKKVIKEKKDKKDKKKKSKKDKSKKGDDDAVIDVEAPLPDVENPKKSKKSKSKGKYDLDQYQDIQAYAPSPMQSSKLTKKSKKQTADEFDDFAPENQEDEGDQKTSRSKHTKSHKSKSHKSKSQSKKDVKPETPPSDLEAQGQPQSDPDGERTKGSSDERQKPTTSSDERNKTPTNDKDQDSDDNNDKKDLL